MRKTKSSPTILLIILDGFGYSQEKNNAIVNAKKPFFDSLLAHYPYTFLQASGQAVGLLAGQISDSQVGHLTIGSGRVVQQASTIITKSCEDGSFFHNPVLLESMSLARSENKTLHIAGLLSDGLVHSAINHLFALLEMVYRFNIKHVSLHLFLDGIDVVAQSAARYLTELEWRCKEYKNVILSTIHGRFFAMDRDKNWERTHKSYECMTKKQETAFSTWADALTYYYERGIFDEFIPPTQIQHCSLIKQEDILIFFNVRADRMSQLAESFLTTEPFVYFSRPHLPLSRLVTLVDYALGKSPLVAFKQQKIFNTLKDVLSQEGKRILSIAESEKCAHISYFFNGYRSEAVPHETQIIIPSLPRSTYVENPCMSASFITNTVVKALAEDEYDFYLINYANADMVGHSGNVQAIERAVECLDKELCKIITAAQKKGAAVYITADHGNAEGKTNQTEKKGHKGHTANPVYFIMINNDLKESKEEFLLATLADIAPFILRQLNLKIPEEMRH